MYLGSLKGRLGGDRSQLEDLLRQLPDSQEDVRERLEQLVACYEVVEASLEEAAPRQGAEDAASRAGREAQQTAGQTAHQAQDVNGQAADEQTREAAAGSRETLGAEIGEEEIRILVIEEEIVVEKRPVVKEEIRVRKRIVEEEEVVEEDVRREEADVVDEQIERKDG